MIRNVFNTGEVSPSLLLRSDIDNYRNACSEITNFDIMETGGVTKRKGFSPVLLKENDAEIEADASSALYVYNATDDETHLVLVSLSYQAEEPREELTVIFTIFHIDPVTGKAQQLDKLDITFNIAGSGTVKSAAEFKAMQMNYLMLFTHPNIPIIELGKKDGSWYLKEFAFKKRPWYTSEIQDTKVTATKYTESEAYGDNTYEIKPASIGNNVEVGDFFKIEYNKPETEIIYRYQDIASVNPPNLEDTIYPSGRQPIDWYGLPGTSWKKGDMVCFRDWTKGDEYRSNWAAKAHYDASTHVGGMDHPKLYPAIFERTDVSSSWYYTRYLMATQFPITRGQVIVFREEYYHFYTCIKDFDIPEDEKTVYGSSPLDYPDYFREGWEIGHTTCKGKWSFTSEGTWYGGFKIQVSYDTKEEDFSKKEWIDRGSIFSSQSEPINQTISGDESQEECYIRLIITRASRYATAPFLNSATLPCPSGMRLKVNAYKHDCIFKRIPGSCLFELQKEFEEADFPGNKLESEYWSKQSFSKENGYPSCACLLDQRLVFAGTKTRPMNILMSQVNDIDNFDIIDADNSALDLTMSSNSQEPIRWIASQRGRLLVGTSQGEFVVTSSDGGVITPSNASCIQHGFNGSETTGNIVLEDSVIYISKGGMRAKKYGYSESIDGYVSTDLNVYADHILAGKGGVKQMATQKVPYPRVYFLTNNGQLSVLAYNERHNVLGWSKYKTESGEFSSVANMQVANNDDIGFVIIHRKSDDKYILASTGITPVYADCGELYTATLTTNIIASTEIGGGKRTLGEIMLYIANDTPTEGISVTVNNWLNESLAPDQKAGVLKAGWNDQLGFSTIEWDAIAGFKSRSLHPLTVLALQVR